MILRLFAFGLGVIAIAVPAGAQDDPLSRLETARARWEAAGLADYRYEYQKFCECRPHEPPVTVVDVAGDEVARVHHRHDDSDREVPARDGSLALYWTVDQLFDKLVVAYGREAHVAAEYDPELGYPVALFIDYDVGFSGDETDLRAIRLERP